MRKVSIVFLSALLLNIVWENLHSYLYLNYKGGEITEFILIRASLFDALLITLIALPFFYLPYLKNKRWLIVVFGIVIAVWNEFYGLSTGRWAYNELMPIIPFLNIGLTPTLQLGILGYVSYKIWEYTS